MGGMVGNGEAENYRPHFSCDNFKRSIKVFAIDVLLLFFVCGGFFLFIRYVVLQTRIDVGVFSGQNWVDLIGSIVWPFALMVLVFVFRNPLLLLLYEAQGFIARSYFRQGNGDIKNRDENSEPLSEHATLTSGEESGQRERDIARRILDCMERQYRMRVQREMCIKDTRYFFDGVMRVNNTIFGIEVKNVVEAQVWQKVLNRVQSVFESFDESLKQRFVFVACIVGEDPVKERSVIEHLALNQRFRVVPRFYEKGKDDELKEVL